MDAEGVAALVNMLEALRLEIRALAHRDASRGSHVPQLERAAEDYRRNAFSYADIALEREKLEPIGPGDGEGETP